ncbi:hypothetical protein A9Y76_20760 [Ralstonia insidiosa]|uniref:Uncharacterized protein n=1 Tax=Ralstonia insidiosa TaxID=190721 RepID=A0A192A3W7_9RALS|nr:hypothetical protein A9Y76_20760 [Ralstonia insidiosa]
MERHRQLISSGVYSTEIFNLRLFHWMSYLSQRQTLGSSIRSFYLEIWTLWSATSAAEMVHIY